MITLEAIHEGLSNGEFFLEYMPTMSLADGRCIGAEALVRWRRPTGIVPPGDFIPLTDNTPMSGRITYWVIDTIGVEMQAWLRAHPDCHLGINIPPEILGRGGIEYAARNAGLFGLASQIILEVTERGVPDLLGVQSISDYWGQGARLALDDVTRIGGANLSILARCNIHIIKLDKSLIDQITPNHPAPDWLPGITALLHSTDLEIIAEGVETPQQADVLRAAHIQSAQGYLFSRPLKIADFIAFHASRETGAQAAPPS